MKQSLYAWIYDSLSNNQYYIDTNGDSETVYIKTKFSNKTVYSNNIDIITKYKEPNTGEFFGIIDYTNVKFYSNKWFKYDLENLIRDSIIELLDVRKAVDSIIDSFDDKTKLSIKKKACLEYILNSDLREHDYHPVLDFSSDDMNLIEKVRVIFNVDSYCEHYAFEYIEKHPNCLEEYSYIKYFKEQIQLLKKDTGWVQEYRHLYDHVFFYIINNPSNELTISFMVNGKSYSGSIEPFKLIDHYLSYNEPAFNLNDVKDCSSKIVKDNNIKSKPFNIVIKWDNVIEVKYGEKLILKREQFEPIIYKE